MCDDYSYFRWGELHKSAMMTERPVLLPIEARGEYELREYQVAVLQTCFVFCLFDLPSSPTLLFLIKCIHYELGRVGEGRTQM